MSKKPHLPSVPLDEQKLTVTSIESVQVLEFFPDLLLVRVHTDQGIVGIGTVNPGVGITALKDCLGP